MDVTLLLINWFYTTKIILYKFEKKSLQATRYKRSGENNHLRMAFCQRKYAY